MFINQQFPQISLPDVFKHLALGLSAKTTVVTPNRRLALTLKNQFDHFQVNQQRVAWDSADILPFRVFVERIYDDMLYAASAQRLPILLTEIQELSLWESIISDSDEGKLLLAISQTAKFVQEAWQLAHEWQIFPIIKDFPLNEDSKIFLKWAHRFERITKLKRQIDGARLCDLMMKSYAHLSIKKPECLICYGFDRITPQQLAFLNEIAATGCEVMSAQSLSQCESRNGTIQRVTCVDNQDEIYRAAVWARSRLENDHAARIGVVVPSLAKSRNTIMRIFNTMMEPNVRSALPGAIRRSPPFNVSLGIPLTSYPIIDAIFQTLTLAGTAMFEFKHASQLLRSPFLGGGITEMSKRALLDAQIRKRAEPIISLERLLTLVKHEKAETSCPSLSQLLSALTEFRQLNLHALNTPSTWVKNFSILLKLIGYPGERTLDSTEYQTLKKWHEVVANFATLDHVIATIGYDSAVSRLRRVASETLFQPETPDVPIQILGVLEAAGMEFDHVWIMGLSDEEWPLHPRPNPFLPVELQRITKLPMGSTGESLAFSQQLTKGWLSCATEVVVSHPAWSGDHQVKPSSLIKHVSATSLNLPDYPSHRDLILKANNVECGIDHEALPLNRRKMGQDSIGGGTAVIKDYAACPFRALAKHRLNVESLAVPHIGLSAMERGVLVHDVLAQIWQQLKTKAALDQVNADELEKLLQRSADNAIIHFRRIRTEIFSGRFAEIERRRLISLAYEWLEKEKKRGHFAIVATEDKRRISVGGLSLITRLDRIDELDNGQRIIIDYKTQQSSVNAFLDERPDEPQLPLYLIYAEPDAAAMIFALVKTKDMKFIGIACDEDLIPGVKGYSELAQCQQYESWSMIVDSWRNNLESLAKGFSSGDAKVDPKRYPITCRYCDVQPLCRIHEKIGINAVMRDDEV